MNPPAQAAGVKKYPVPNSSSLNAITPGPDGAIWFTEPFRNGISSIGRITSDGVITHYPIPPYTDLPGIATGSDGALWFIESWVFRIGRITTAGVVTEYPIPHTSTGYGFRAITAGPDGALWFTDQYSDAIGRITTAGDVTVYPLTPGRLPNSITAGPDGALWFTETGLVNRIGRITTAGDVTEYRVPTYSFAWNITAGSDGALWFSETSDHKIGRITTTGVITEYRLPLSDPVAITAGPDGAVWFGDAKQIGRITSDGFVTEYIVDLQFDVGNIAPGPDGAIWFTQPSPDPVRLGRAWACGAGLQASYANTTLNLGYHLSISLPAVFDTALFVNNRLKPLWFRPIPAVAPPKVFTIPIGPGFPSSGEVGVLSVLKSAATGETFCIDWKTVDTGAGGASAPP